MNLNDLKNAISQNMSLLSNIQDPQNDNAKKIQIVKVFQNGVCGSLKDLSNGYKWDTEHPKGSNGKTKDPNGEENYLVDIFGQKEGDMNWIIEIDASRADQVAKKMVSRFALYGLKKPIQYVAIIYPGTKKMPVGPCIKYLKYGNDIIKRLNEESSVVGIFVYPNGLKGLNKNADIIIV